MPKMPVPCIGCGRPGGAMGLCPRCQAKVVSFSVKSFVLPFVKTFFSGERQEGPQRLPDGESELRAAMEFYGFAAVPTIEALHDARRRFARSLHPDHADAEYRDQNARLMALANRYHDVIAGAIS